MNSIESEWQKLRGNLTDEQAKDGRRCFFCGVLLVLSDLFSEEGRLHPSYLFTREAEVRRALRIDGDDGDPELPKGA